MEQGKIAHLDYYVLETLKALKGWSYPEVDLKKSDHNIFMGSGSAYCTAQLWAKKFGGIALNASEYKEYLENRVEKNFESLNIVSASGGKDSIPMAQFCNDILRIKPNLITCNAEAPAKEYCAKIFAFPSFQEPPTYNTSTYGSMIYWLFGEDPQTILDFVSQMKIPDLRQYHYVFFMSDDKHATIAEMACRKIAETNQGVATNSAGFTHGAHGMLRQPDEKRLVVAMNMEYPFAKEHSYSIKLDSYLGLMMATYYIIGKNQNDQDTDNILKDYAEVAAKFGWKFNKIN